MSLTQKRVNEVFKFDPDKGRFSRRPPKTNKYAYFGNVMAIDEDGDYIVSIDNETLKAKDLVWFLWNTSFPDKEVEFIDGNKLNIRPSNLKLKEDIQKVDSFIIPSTPEVVETPVVDEVTE